MIANSPDFEGAELDIYLTNGDVVPLDVTPTMLQAMLTVIGFQVTGADSYKTFSDQTIRQRIMPRLSDL